jgi:pilus assembly protein CpaE
MGSSLASATFLLHVQDESLRREALEVLRHSVNSVPLEQHSGTWDSLIQQIGAVKPDVLLLDLSLLPLELSVAIRQLRFQNPRLKVIAIHATADPHVILSAMRGGANEFVYCPLKESLRSALDRLALADEGTTGTRGKVIGFLSAKGGCGATTISCHIAAELQNLTRRSVLLADLDLPSGLVGFLMKTPSSYSVLDGIKNLSRLDESLWKALVIEHKPGLSVIPAPAVYSRWDHPEEGQLIELLQFMRTQHEWVVLDLGRSLNSIASAVLEEIDQLFLISTLEVVALHGLKTIVHGLFEQGEKLQLVLNRTPKTMNISTQELEKVLGRSLYAALPNDYMSLYQSYSTGNLLDAHNRLAQEFSRFASKIAGVQPMKTKKKFALFG